MDQAEMVRVFEADEVRTKDAGISRLDGSDAL